ncbi:uncharacterized protein LOC108345076 [Vigna angularis]|uniref:uncharacterized protein LOC108345076 n=1 Tax=Phaseolus angularis TaxID=3914 RepID=UPI0022B446F2|nr:uncharacterized protein LOC108345076 [Vigna angularis]
MQQKFVNKYFPATKAANIRREITSTGQFQEESLAEYWERFSNLCTTCPNHQISEPRLLVYFYEDLLYKDKVLVDAAAGGSLLDKTPTEARKLLSKLSGENHDEVADEPIVQN